MEKKGVTIPGFKKIHTCGCISRSLCSRNNTQMLMDVAHNVTATLFKIKSKKDSLQFHQKGKWWPSELHYIYSLECQEDVTRE